MPTISSLKRYGLDPDAFQALAKSQYGRCACCDELAPKLQVDHDHAREIYGASLRHTIRGLVCASCNSRIGKLENGHMSCRDPGYIQACKYLASFGKTGRWCVAPGGRHKSSRPASVECCAGCAIHCPKTA
jgi:hypothetical protein